MSEEGRRRSVFPGFADIQTRRQEMIDELVAARKLRGVSQTEVARRMGTSQSAVARLESSSADLRLSTLERYAAALDLRLEWRLEG